jgi:retinol dehydrogenase-14
MQVNGADLYREGTGGPGDPIALHPGVVRTGFGAEDPGRAQRLFVPFLRPFLKSPTQGAATSIHVASARDLEQVTGRYFANSKPKSSAKRSYDEAVAARLWRLSAELVGLTGARRSGPRPAGRDATNRP